MQQIILYIFTVVLLASCGGKSPMREAKIYVSIEPLKEIVTGIVGEDIAVEVLVPSGASPESFEPTAKQYAGLNDARKIFSTGLLDFETTLLSRLEMPEKVVNMSRGIEVIAGSCSHSEHGNKHEHGIDPHIWTSPKALKIMAANAYDAIHDLWPDSVKYSENYKRILHQYNNLDSIVAAKIANSGVTKFIIYHPALTYYARDYGLEQIAVEADGKEPSAKRLGEIIGRARGDGTAKILYQSQYPVSVVEVIAKDINAKAVKIDPLRGDITTNLLEITDIITSK